MIHKCKETHKKQTNSQILRPTNMLGGSQNSQINKTAFAISQKILFLALICEMFPVHI